MKDLLDHVKTLEISYEVSRRVIAELTAEAQRLRELETFVKQILTQKGDDHCWRDWRGNYEELARLVGVPFKPCVLDKPTMMRNCEHFVDCLLSGEHYVTPTVSKGEFDRLAAERDAIRAALVEAKATRPRCGVAEGSGCDYADECDALRAERDILQTEVDQLKSQWSDVRLIGSRWYELSYQLTGGPNGCVSSTQMEK